MCWLSSFSTCVHTHICVHIIPTGEQTYACHGNGNVSAATSKPLQQNNRHVTYQLQYFVQFGCIHLYTYFSISAYGKVCHSSWNSATKKIFCVYQLANNGSTLRYVQMIARGLVVHACAHRRSHTEQQFYLLGCRYGVETLSLQYFDDPQNAHNESWCVRCRGC